MTTTAAATATADEQQPATLPAWLQTRDEREQLSDRARTGYLAEARRCCTARTNLLLTCGVIPKAPEHLYRATVNLKPQDLKGSADDENFENMSREEAIEELIQKMEKTRLLR